MSKTYDSLNKAREARENKNNVKPPPPAMHKSVADELSRVYLSGPADNTGRKGDAQLVPIILAVCVAFLFIFNIMSFNMLRNNSFEITNSAKRLETIESLLERNLGQINNIYGELSKLRADLGTLSIRLESDDMRIKASLIRIERNERLLSKNAIRVSGLEEDLTLQSAAMANFAESKNAIAKQVEGLETEFAALMPEAPPAVPAPAAPPQSVQQSLSQ